MADIKLDLDQTITAAVNARVEAEMLKALSGDETIGKFVVAALQQQVDVSSDRYSRDGKESYLAHLLRGAIQAATKEAVVKLIAEELPTIEAEVRKALRRNVAHIADTLSQSLVDAASKGYGVNVELHMKLPRDY